MNAIAGYYHILKVICFNLGVFEVSCIVYLQDLTQRFKDMC